MKTKPFNKEQMMIGASQRKNYQLSFLAILLLVCCTTGTAFAQSFDFYSFEQRRLNVGRQDNNNDGKPDNNLTAIFGQRNENVMLAGDTMEFTIKARVLGSGSYSRIYLVDYSSDLYNITGHELHSVLLNNSPLNITATFANDDYCSDCYDYNNYYYEDWGNYSNPYVWAWELSKTNGSDFVQGDSVKIVLRYVADSLEIAGTSYRIFDIYATVNPMYDIWDIANPGIDRIGGGLEYGIIEKYNQQSFSTYDSYSLGGVVSITNYGPYTLLGGGFHYNDDYYSDNYNVHLGAFPYEYRPMYIIDSVEIVAPIGYVLDNSQTFTLSFYDAIGNGPYEYTIGLTATPATTFTPERKVFKLGADVFDSVLGALSGSVPPFVPPSGYFGLNHETYTVIATPAIYNGMLLTGVTWVHMTDQTNYAQGESVSVGWLNYYDNQMPGSYSSIHVNRDLTIRDLTPEELVEQIFVKGDGSCGSVSNVTFTAHGWDGSTWTDADIRGLGYFSKGDTNFEFEEGLVLSTGGLSSIEGPNNNVSGVGSPSAPLPTQEPDLHKIVTNSTNYSRLEFDFVPVSNVIQFNYIFASEEYANFVGGPFNDVFGFFITGPGIGNGIDPENIALLPTTETATRIVSLNNVNDGARLYDEHNCPKDIAEYNPTEPEYFPYNRDYYKNIPGNFSSCLRYPLTFDEINLHKSMQFNGRTVVLTAAATVTPCQTYHLKLAVANAADQAYQSGVFLEAKSFDIGDNLINYGNNIEGMDHVFRGCNNNKLVVSRAYVDASPVTITLSYGGNAVNGVDISSAGSAMPASVVIPGGQQSVEIFYTVNTPPTGAKTFTITSGCPCGGGGAVFTKTIYIYDQSTGSFTVTPSPSCPGVNSGRISVAGGFGGSSHYESSIDGGLTWQSSLLPFTGLAAGSYTVHVRDSGSCHIISPQNITITTEAVSANAGANQSSCNYNFTMAAQSLTVGQAGLWTVVTGTASITNPLSPTTGVTLSSATATLMWTVTAAGGCQASDYVTLTANSGTLSVSLSASTSTLCSGASATLTAMPSSGTGTPTTYTWYRNGTFTMGTTTGNTYNVPNITATATYTVGVANSSGCTGTSNAVTIIVNPTPSGITATAPAVCSGSATTFTATVSSGTTSPMTYTWNINGVNYTTTSTTYSRTLAVGNSSYSLSVTNSYGCTSSYTAAQTTTVNPLPSVSASANPTTVCSGGSVTFTATTLSGATSAMTYTWVIAGTSATTTSTTYIRAVSATSSYSLSARNANGCTSTYTAPQTVTVASSATPTVTISASVNNVCSGTPVTYTVTNYTAGGTSPSPTFQWKVGSAVVGTGSSYTYAPANNDVITCVMTTNDPCASSPTATSNPITMIITPTVVPSVTITATPD